jgi:hypothetical protein
MSTIRPKLKLKRQQVRRRRHQSAWIRLDEETTSRKCEVSDVSHEGAKITVDLVLEVGKLFSVAFVPRGAARRCEVVWRRANTLGIKFVG